MESNEDEADFRIMDLDAKENKDQIEIWIGDSCGNVIKVTLKF
jgi:hypothetical protein